MGHINLYLNYKQDLFLIDLCRHLSISKGRRFSKQDCLIYLLEESMKNFEEEKSKTEPEDLGYEGAPQ